MHVYKQNLKKRHIHLKLCMQFLSVIVTHSIDFIDIPHLLRNDAKHRLEASSSRTIVVTCPNPPAQKVRKGLVKRVALPCPHTLYSAYQSRCSKPVT